MGRKSYLDKGQGTIGEVVFAAFDCARKSNGLMGNDLVSEGLIPNRQKLYVV